MKIFILEDVEFEGRSFVKGDVVLFDSKEASRIVATGKAAKEETNRSVGLESSDVEVPVKRKK